MSYRSWFRPARPGPLVDSLHFLALALSLALLATACEDGPSISDPRGAEASQALSTLPPADLVSISSGGGSLTLWPYTGADFSGTPQDPINLVFTGKSDPRAIRGALLSLPGNRSAFGFPDVFPFNCTWSDAIGDLQTGYNQTVGWTGSAIQLQCASFGPIRFHVRLFDAGPVTLGNAHFEVLIPGTADHQVISWELAEQLVTVDMVRSGLLASGPATTGPINASPTFREIPAVVYNGVPADLKAAIGGPPGNVSTAVGIGNSGAATVFALGQEIPGAPGSSLQDFTIQFAQFIPRPFCAESPADLVRLDGPVNLRKQVHLAPSGALTSEFTATGTLQLQRIDAGTGLPVGPPYQAQVQDHQETRFDDAGGTVNGVQMQTELPQGLEGRGRRTIRLKVGPGGVTLFDRDIDCHL